MKLGWKSIKISIAGARLSHLVQENSKWDHGSMIEQVKTVFIYLKKAYLRSDPSIVKKCLTAKAYKITEADIELQKENPFTDAELVSADIVSVLPSKYNRDKFKVLMKFRPNRDRGLEFSPRPISGARRQFQQQWLFICEGAWWLLDEINI